LVRQACWATSEREIVNISVFTTRKFIGIHNYLRRDLFEFIEFNEVENILFATNIGIRIYQIIDYSMKDNLNKNGKIHILPGMQKQNYYLSNCKPGKA